MRQAALKAVVLFHNVWCLQSIAVLRNNKEDNAVKYIAIAKGRGFVYTSRNQMYRCVRTAGNTKYLKWDTVSCDGSAKLVGGEYTIWLFWFAEDWLFFVVNVYKETVIDAVADFYVLNCSCVSYSWLMNLQ